MLTKRLQACLELVTPGGVACDVGTDHAYLAVALLETGRCQRVIASDIGEGPLQAARRTVQQHGLQQRVQLVLSDGLQQVPSEGVTDVVLAGMGGETMIHILSDCPWIRESTRTLIFQPMTKIPLLRSWLAQQGFSILQEQVLAESKHRYRVMQVRWSGTVQPLSFLEEQFGAVDWSSPVVWEDAKEKQRRFAAVAQQLQEAGKEEAQAYQALADCLAEKLAAEQQKGAETR